MKNVYGPFLIAIGAFLWALDTLFRVKSLEALDPLWIVFSSHVIALLTLSVFIPFQKTSLKLNNSKEFLAMLFCGAGGSALATVFFSWSFLYLNPSITILLQKLQPLVASLAATLILKEKIKLSFYPLAIVALFSAYALSFPSLDFSFSSQDSSNLFGIFLALSAAVLWGLSTVFGRMFLKKQSAFSATWWRFLFGSFILTGTLLINKSLWPKGVALVELQNLSSLLYMALLSGLLAVYIYYQGLKRTSAIAATFTELLFPLFAVLINWVYLGQELNSRQICFALLLLSSSASLSYLHQRN